MGFLDFLIPGFILEQEGSMMFPTPWHRRFNYLWLAQVCIAMLWCLRSGRWVPAWNGNFKPWPLRQFMLLLFVHSLFYIVELYVTSMWSKFTQMAIHHVGALIVFSTVLFEPNAISVVCLTPFLLHAAYWVHGATSDELLGVYNSLMLTCGSIGLHNNFALGSVDRPITYILPLAVLVVTWDNYFTYCYSYRGTMCYRHENFTLRRNTFMYAAVVGFCINIIVVWFVAVHISRRRWAALGIRPWFAKPQDLGEPARAAGESATSAQGTSASARLAGLFSGAANLVMSYVPSAATRRHVHSRVPVEDIEAVSGGEVEAVRMKEFDLAAMKREE